MCVCVFVRIMIKKKYLVSKIIALTCMATTKYTHVTDRMCSILFLSNGPTSFWIYFRGQDPKHFHRTALLLPMEAEKVVCCVHAANYPGKRPQTVWGGKMIRD